MVTVRVAEEVPADQKTEKVYAMLAAMQQAGIGYPPMSIPQLSIRVSATPSQLEHFETILAESDVGGIEVVD